MSFISYSIFNQVGGVAGTDANAPTTQGVLVSGTNTAYSQVITGRHADGMGATFQWTGTPTGTLTRWVTDKPNPGLLTDADWVQDTGFSPTNPAGASGQFRDDTSGDKGMMKRYKYVNASGSGTLFGWVNVPRMA